MSLPGLLTYFYLKIKIYKHCDIVGSNVIQYTLQRYDRKNKCCIRTQS